MMNVGRCTSVYDLQTWMPKLKRGEGGDVGVSGDEYAFVMFSENDFGKMMGGLMTKKVEGKRKNNCIKIG